MMDKCIILFIMFSRQNKINVIDHNKIETEISKNLDDKIKNIFSNKD